MLLRLTGASRTVAAVARCTPSARPLIQVSRRWASSSGGNMGDGGPSSGTSPSQMTSNHHHHDNYHGHANDGREPMGWAFYVTFATPVIVYVLHGMASGSTSAATRPEEMMWFQRRLVEWQNDMASRWQAANAARVQAYEYAAETRHLEKYANDGKPRYHEIRSPELLWSACEWNVPAGHYINLDKLQEHYREKFYEVEDRKLRKLKVEEEEAREKLAREGEPTFTERVWERLTRT